MGEIKTLKEWDEKDCSLDEYLPEPCEIDEDIANYIGECVAPNYINNFMNQGLCQGGDAQDEEDGVFWYMTVLNKNNKYFYLGVLPEFKEEE